MKGKIVVIEGVDSVGKHTQAETLKKRLIESGYKVYLHSFPTYDEDQSMLARMYLNGQFGEKANCIDYKIASTFYAVDRVATYLLTLKSKLDEGYVLILDRYTTSNMVHQASKCNGKKAVLEASDWIKNFEFKDLSLPVPNVIIYLNLDQKIREKLLDARRKDNDKDILEKDKEYLLKASKSGIMVAKYNNWDIVECGSKDAIRSIESIGDEIYNIVLGRL